MDGHQDYSDRMSDELIRIADVAERAHPEPGE